MIKYSELTDVELFTLLQDKEEVAAFVEIYNRYWDKLYRAAYKRLRTSAPCEEIVQEVFTNFWLKNREISIHIGLSNYLYTSVRNKVIDYYRRQLVRRNFSINFSQVDYDDSSEQEVILRDLQNQLEQSLNQLPDKCRSVYVLSRIEQQSNKEIALQLNISEKTVEGHLTKALKQLRISLSDFLVLFFMLLKIYFF